MTCKVCGCSRYVGDTQFETHQRATIGGVTVDICYGPCLLPGRVRTYHRYEPIPASPETPEEAAE